MKPKLTNPKNIISVFLIFYIFQLNAQSNASAELDINNIRARLHVTGDHFSDLVGSPKFEVPKGSYLHTIYASALWIGGMYNDDLYLAAMTYRQTGEDFWAGPLDSAGKTNKATAQAWDEMIKIDKSEVEDFIDDNNKATDAIKNWPAKGNNGITRDMAPFVDVNKDGKYNYADGDYPCIKGDRMLWWLFNDQLKHGETGGKPLGVEVYGIAYEYKDNPLANTLFLEYDILNRSDRIYDSVYAGIWTDFDLGYFKDDYLGCDTGVNIYYAYNSSNNDTTSVPGVSYGQNPPVQAVAFLNRELEYFFAYENDYSVTGNPVNDMHYYQYMTGSYKNGNTFSHNGKPFKCIYPGHPADQSAWSEKSAGNKPGDRRGLGSVKIGTLKPGQAEHISIAYVYARKAGEDNIGNVDAVINEVNTVKSFYDNKLAGECRNIISGDFEHDEKHEQALIYPNPALNVLNIQMYEPVTGNVEILDLLGRILLTEKLSNTDKKVLYIGNLAPGTYLVKLNNGNKTSVYKISKD